MTLRYLGLLFAILFATSTNAQKIKFENFLEVDHKKTSRSQSTSTIDRAIFYSLNTQKLNTRKKSEDHLNLEVPVFNKSVRLRLQKVNILSSQFQVKTAKGEFVTDGSNYQFYHGYVVGKQESSIAAVTIRNGEFSLLISDESGDFQIDRFDENHHIGYYSNELKEQIPFECFTEETSLDKFAPKQTRSAPSSDCVDIYFEVDYAAFVRKNRSLSSTTDWVVGLFNHVSIQYNKVGIPLRISEIVIHTETDPFAVHSDMHSVLGAFRSLRNQTGFNGRIAHFLSTRGLGGGVAYINALCSNYSNYSVSGNLNGNVVNFPNYSWNVMVISHELGHNFGSPHTQSCSWNGNGTAIDGCVDTGAACPRPGLPENGGTIMSYCHLNSSVGINLAKGFHPQPGQLIYERFATADCILSQDCSEVPTVNDECVSAINLTPNQSCIEWSYHNINSSQSSGMTSFSCGNANDTDDVWFSVEIPSSGQLIVETSTINNGLSDLIMEAYTGECNALSLLLCDDNSGPGNHAKISVDDIALANETIFLRVGEKGSNQEGEFSICSYSPTVPCPDYVETLIDFYTLLDGPNWTNNNGWAQGAAGEDCNVCLWYGVSCNNNGEVISINLSDNNLSGSLNDDIDTFSTLLHLDLSDNNLSGILPDDITKISTLKTLALNNNNFIQAIPENVYQLRALTYLDLSNNGFTGNTPRYIGYHRMLDHLDLSNNNLSGCFDSGLYSLCDISYFSLAGNTGLPYDGDVTPFCFDRSGTDSDRDGHCFNITDCDDYNKDVFDGNPDICDGLDNDCDGQVDNGFSNLVNEFLDVDTHWNAAENWSLGHPPIACEEVWIGMDGVNCILSMPVDTYGVRFKGLKIGVGSQFIIPESSYLDLTSLAFIENHGSITVNGGIYSSKTDASLNYGLRNFGEINIIDGSIGFGDQNGTVIINESSGTIINRGYISMYIHTEDSPVENGIVNYGTIINHNSIQIQGSLTGDHIVLKPSSTFSVYKGSEWDQVSVGN